MYIQILFLKRTLAGAVIFLFCLATSLTAAAQVRVFAAASTTNALSEIAGLFKTESSLGVQLSFAASSTLAKQIHRGAPAHVYLSANPKWMNFLDQKGLVEPGTRTNLLGNRIVLIAPAKNPLTVVIKPGFDLPGLLGDGRLAMGDPDHVPAGIYGKKALEKLGVWCGVRTRTARTKDVRAALALVARGEAALGQVYATDAAISGRVVNAGFFPMDSHPPIVYPVALVSGQADEPARAFLAFLKSDAAAVVFRKFGFLVP